MVAVDKLTVQLTWVPAALPVQEAGKLLLPCKKLICVVQLAGLLLHGRLVPVSVKAKLVKLSAKLAVEGDSVLTRGKVELVVSISRTFCR